MADWTTVPKITILTRTAVTHPNTVEGAAQDVASIDQVLITTFWASIEAAANTNAGSFLVQVSGEASGDDDWSTIAEISTPIDTSNSEVLSNDAESGPALEVANTTGYAAGEWLYARDVTVEGNSSWRLIDKIVTNTSVDVIDALTVALNGSTDSDLLWSDAQVESIHVDVAPYQRIRLIFSHEGTTGVNGVVEATMATATDYED